MQGVSRAQARLADDRTVTQMSIPFHLFPFVSPVFDPLMNGVSFVPLLFGELRIRRFA